MDQDYNGLKLLLLGLFVLISAGLWGYDALYVWPSRACEAKGDWWDDKDRVCAVPMPLSHWTGRTFAPLHDPHGTAAPAPAKPR